MPLLSLLTFDGQVARLAQHMAEHRQLGLGGEVLMMERAREALLDAYALQRLHQEIDAVEASERAAELRAAIEAERLAMQAVTDPGDPNAEGAPAEDVTGALIAATVQAPAAASPTRADLLEEYDRLVQEEEASSAELPGPATKARHDRMDEIASLIEKAPLPAPTELPPVDRGVAAELDAAHQVRQALARFLADQAAPPDAYTASGKPTVAALQALMPPDLDLTAELRDAIWAEHLAKGA